MSIRIQEQRYVRSGVQHVLPQPGEKCEAFNAFRRARCKRWLPESCSKAGSSVCSRKEPVRLPSHPDPSKENALARATRVKIGRVLESKLARIKLGLRIIIPTLYQKIGIPSALMLHGRNRRASCQSKQAASVNNQTRTSILNKSFLVIGGPVGF